MDEKCEQFLNRKSSASGCCLAFAWFFAKFSLTLLIKVLLIKKKSVGSYFCKMFHHRCLTVFWIRLRFWIYQGSEYASSSENDRVPNILFPKYNLSQNIRKLPFLKIRQAFFEKIIRNFFRAGSFRKKYQKCF